MSFFNSYLAILQKLMACLFVYSITQQIKRGVCSTQLYYVFHKKGGET